jgi:hypothetical protein
VELSIAWFNQRRRLAMDWQSLQGAQRTPLVEPLVEKINDTCGEVRARKPKSR